jgi:hypothetical protein
MMRYLQQQFCVVTFDFRSHGETVRTVTHTKALNTITTAEVKLHRARPDTGHVQTSYRLSAAEDPVLLMDKLIVSKAAANYWQFVAQVLWCAPRGALGIGRKE